MILKEGGKHLNIILRDIDPHIMKSIDEKAKKNNESRQVYLKKMIENFIMLNEFNDREKEFKVTLEKNTEVINLLQEKLEKNNQLLEELSEEGV